MRIRRPARVVLLGCAAILAASLAILLAAWMAPDAHADSKADDYSLYKVASASSSYFDIASNPDQDEYGMDVYSAYYGPAGMDQSGMFVGFPDEDYDSGLVGSLVSFLSKSIANTSYEAYPAEAPGVIEYVHYGRALDALGVDGTGFDSFDLVGLLRVFQSVVTLLGYCAASCIDGLFALVLAAVDALNPFAWLIDGVSNVAGITGWTSSTVPDWASGLADTVSDLYVGFAGLGFSLATVVFFCTLAAALMAWQATGRTIRNAAGKYAVRIGFIILGVPLLGAMYTEVIDLASQSVTASGSQATRAVASTFLDFEQWAKQNRLALPEGTRITISGSSVDLSNTTSERVLVRKINQLSGAYAGSIGSLDSSDMSSLLDISSSPSSQVGYADQFAATMNVLARYMSGDKYTAANYETMLKEQLRNGSDSETVFKCMRSTAGSQSKYAEQAVQQAEGCSTFMNNGSSADFGFANAANGDGGSCIGCASSLIDENGTTYQVTYQGHATGPATKTGLSSMSMYNYLTTEFTGSDVMVYSSHKAVSKLTFKSHYSVSIPGANGFVSLLYWLNLSVMLVCLSILGVSYAIGMLINVIKRQIRLLVSLMPAMAGSVKAIARFAMHVGMLVVEILGTFFVYSLVAEFLLNISSIVEIPAEQAASATINAGSRTLGGVLADSSTPLGYLGGKLGLYVGLVVSIIIYVWLTRMGIKLRVQIIRTLDDTLGELIDRFFTFSTNGDVHVAQTMPKTTPARMPGRGIAGQALGSLGAGIAAGRAITGMGNDAADPTDATDAAAAQDGRGVKAGLPAMGATGDFDRQQATDATAAATPAGMLPAATGDGEAATGSPLASGPGDADASVDGAATPGTIDTDDPGRLPSSLPVDTTSTGATAETGEPISADTAGTATGQDTAGIPSATGMAAAMHADIDGPGGTASATATGPAGDGSMPDAHRGDTVDGVQAAGMPALPTATPGQPGSMGTTGAGARGGAPVPGIDRQQAGSASTSGHPAAPDNAGAPSPSGTATRHDNASHADGTAAHGIPAPARHGNPPTSSAPGERQRQDKAATARPATTARGQAPAADTGRQMPQSGQPGFTPARSMPVARRAANAPAWTGEGATRQAAPQGGQPRVPAVQQQQPVQRQAQPARQAPPIVRQDAAPGAPPAARRTPDVSRDGRAPRPGQSGQSGRPDGGGVPGANGARR